MEMTKQEAKRCEQCKHYDDFAAWEAWGNACNLGHKPRWYRPKKIGDLDYGFKRKCEDYEAK
jgi:hypothetical protein